MEQTHIIEALKLAYANNEIDYNDIPEKYKEFIDEVRVRKE